MVIERGEIWWANLRPPLGSGPGFARPVLVVQDDRFNRSTINTVIVLMFTTNLKLLGPTGNVLISSDESGLPEDSVVNVSQVLTIDKSFLVKRMGKLRGGLLEEVEAGLRGILGL